MRFVIILLKQYSSDLIRNVFNKVEEEVDWSKLHCENSRFSHVDAKFLYEFVFYMYNRRVYSKLDLKLVEIIENDVESLVDAVKERDYGYAEVIFGELQFLFDTDYPEVKAKFLDYLRKRYKKSQLKRADNLQNNLEQSKVKKYKERYSVLDSVMRKKLPER
jgi:hypothetical protein